MAAIETTRTARGALVAFLLASLAGDLRAAEPVVRNLDIRGLQVGGTTRLVIDGDALGASPRLLLPFAAKQALKGGSTPKRATFEVTLAGDVVPGFYNLRLVSEGGVSLPQAIAVDRFVQQAIAARVERLPVALHGSVGGSTVVSVPFSGKSGDKFTAEVEARRLGSALRPVIHLHDARRRELAWAWGKPLLGGDARLQVTLPADGAYTVTVHDAEYSGTAPAFFRLKIGQYSVIDQVFPSVIGKDQKSVELLGPTETFRVGLPARRDSLFLPLPWPKGGPWSGPRPFVTSGTRAEVVNRGDGKVQDLPSGAVGVSGRLARTNGEDRYRIAVKPGDTLRLEVLADRIGSPLHPTLTLRDEKGGVLARVEESSASLDPVLDYTVPPKISALHVGVEDSQGTAGRTALYRLHVTPSGLAAGREDFRLYTRSQKVILPQGGRCVFPVIVERRGYQGAVELAAEGLPRGTKVEGARIDAGSDGTLVTVERGPGACEAVLSSWRGRADNKVERPVLLVEGPLAKVQPWLAGEMAVAPSTVKASDYQINWRSLPTEVGLPLAGRLTLPVKVTRTAANDIIRLTLLSSQPPPTVNGQPDLGRTLRVERAVELPAKTTEGDVPLLIPAELASPSYDLAVQAEWLGPDRRTVLATAHTPVRRLPVRQPLLVRMDGAARVEVKLVPKMPTRFEIKGKVERREGLKGDVSLTLTGLPPGSQAPGVAVKSGSTDFAFKVALPASLLPGEYKGVKILANAVADPARGLRIDSLPVELTLNVQGPGK